MVSTGGPCVGDTTHWHVGLRAVRIGGDPDVARPLTDRKVRPVFAIGPLERVASLNCVGFFRPVLHEAATAAVPARTLLWSLDLQPRPPLSHICVLTAEDILVEHSSKQQARTVYGYRDGTAFSAVAPKQRPAPQPAHRNNQKGPTLFQALDRKK